MRKANGHLQTTLVLCLSVPMLMILSCNDRAPVAVQLMPDSAQTFEPGKSVLISATLSNDTAHQGVSWKLAGEGTLVALTTTSVMYQAPSMIRDDTGAKNPATVTVTAIAIADTEKTASLTIILAPPGRSASDQKSQQEQTAQRHAV